LELTVHIFIYIQNFHRPIVQYQADTKPQVLFYHVRQRWFQNEKEEEGYIR